MNKRGRKLIWKQYKTTIVYGSIFLVVGIAVLVIAIGNEKRTGVKVDREDLATSWLVSGNSAEPSGGGDAAEAGKTPESDTSKEGTEPEGESTGKETQSITAKEKDTTAAKEEDTTAAPTDGQTFTVVQTDGYVNIYSEADVNSEITGTLASGFAGTVLQYGKWMCQIDYEGVRGWVETNYLEVK